MNLKENKEGVHGRAWREGEWINDNSYNLQSNFEKNTNSKMFNLVMVVHAFNPSTRQAEAGRSLVCSRPA